MWFKRKPNKIEEKYVLDKNKLNQQLREYFLDENLVNDLTEKIASDVNEYLTNASEKSKITMSELPYIVEKYLSIDNINFLDRIKICQDINSLLDDYPEAKQAVKIYASSITYGSPEFKLDEYKFIVIQENEQMSIKYINKANFVLNDFEKRTEIKKLIYKLALDLVKFGDAFVEKVYDENNNFVRYAYIPSDSVIMDVDEYGNLRKIYQVLNPKNYNILENKNVIAFEKHEFIHINDSSPLGVRDSIFATIIPLWRSFKLLQESLIIHRVTRAKRYTVFFVDVSGKNEKEIRHSMNAFVRKLKSFFSFDMNKGNNTYYDSSLKTGEDLVIPVTKESNTRMQIIPADTGAHKIDDLNFFNNRILNILFVEHLLGQNKNAKNPDIDKAFNRIIRVYQKQFIWALEKEYNEHLKNSGFEGFKVNIIFPSPDSEEEIKLVDTLVRRLLLITQLSSVLGRNLPMDWVIDYVFKDLTIEELKLLKEKIKTEMMQDNTKEEMLSLSKNNNDFFNDIQDKADVVEKTKEILNMSLKYLEMKKEQ